ncbi:MAG: antibiotic biosynthesis monooxygenase [Candidatus Obscuribacterales bacterium]|nr:antibiotic biosynthesis monooxygenase [Candidatus Obscuribacterales bacterium]
MDSAQISKVSALVLTVQIHSGDTDKLTAWLVKMMMGAAKYPGFLSAEIIPSISENDPQWFLVEWFRTNEDLFNWQASSDRVQLKEELSTLFAEGSLTLKEEITEQAGTRGSVATAIITAIKPGKEKEYQEWASRIKIAQSKFPGYRGTYFQPPMDNRIDNWTTLLRFDTPANLDNWFNSKERNELVLEGQQYVKSTDYHALPVSSFPGWFPVDKKGRPPARWKTAMLVLLCLYPMAVLQFKYVRPLLEALPSEIVTFLSNLASVMIMSWFLMPFAVKQFDKWLYPSETGVSANAKGFAIILALYTIEIALLLVLVH